MKFLWQSQIPQNASQIGCKSFTTTGEILQTLSALSRGCYITAIKNADLHDHVNTGGKADAPPCSNSELLLCVVRSCQIGYETFKRMLSICRTLTFSSLCLQMSLQRTKLSPATLGESNFTHVFHEIVLTWPSVIPIRRFEKMKWPLAKFSGTSWFKFIFLLDISCRRNPERFWNPKPIHVASNLSRETPCRAEWTKYFCQRNDWCN